jgi:hypothetical protein
LRPADELSAARELYDSVIDGRIALIDAPERQLFKQDEIPHGIKETLLG